MPQVTTWADSQKLGLVFFNITLDGISVDELSAPNKANERDTKSESHTEHNIRNKKQSTRNIILVANQAQICVHSLNFRIPHIIAVDMGAQIKACENGDQVEVDL